MKRRHDPPPATERPWRLLYVQPCTDFGGAERQASICAPRLRRFGFDVVPLVGPGGRIVEWLADSGVTDLVHSDAFPGNWPKPFGFRRLALPFRYLECLHRLSAQISEVALARRIQIIVAAMPFSWVAATPVARHLGLPIVWRAGGCEASAAARFALRAWSRRNAPDLLMCCGEEVRNVFGPLVHAPSVVIHNGVDTQMFHPGAGERGRYRPPGARVVVGFAARLAEQKRPQDVIRMAAQVVPHHPGIAFLIAGEGSHRAQYEALARALGVAQAMVFLGYVADIQSFYAACDIVVLPSRSEGCPNVVLESMAMRRALVVSDAAGTGEVIQHQRQGLVFPVGDVAAFASAVRRLLDDAVLRTKLMDDGYARVTGGFSARTQTGRMAELLRRALMRDGSASAYAPRGVAAGEFQGEEAWST